MYSKIRIVKDNIFISGQLPVDENGEVVSGGIKEQTRQVMENIKKIASDNGLTMDDFCKFTLFVRNIKDLPIVNEVYVEYFGDIKPARSAVEVSGLVKDVLIEIDAFGIK